MEEVKCSIGTNHPIGIWYLISFCFRSNSSIFEFILIAKWNKKLNSLPRNLLRKKEIELKTKDFLISKKERKIEKCYFLQNYVWLLNFFSVENSNRIFWHQRETVCNDFVYRHNDEQEKRKRKGQNHHQIFFFFLVNINMLNLFCFSGKKIIPKKK